MKVDSVIAWPTVDFNYGPFPVKEPYNSGAIMAFEEVIDPQSIRDRFSSIDWNGCQCQNAGGQALAQAWFDSVLTI